METIEEAIKCAECKCVLDSPVLLPCSDSVCEKHIKQGDKEYHCLVCDIIHPIPSAGFPRNKSLAILIQEKIQNSNFSPEYRQAFGAFRNLEKVVDEMKLLQKDPHFFINKSIRELKTETDIVRDEFKLAIDQKANEIIKELDKYEEECKSNLRSSDVAEKLEMIEKRINGLNEEMISWQKTLRCFEPNQEALRTINKKAVQYKDELETGFKEYEHEFLLKKLKDYQEKVLSFSKINLQSDRM
jgi:hypothetical protein